MVYGFLYLKCNYFSLVTDILTNGIPAYTTSAGWLAYGDDKIRKVNRIMFVKK